MKKIPLTQGQFALIDDADFKAVNQFKWCAANTRGKFYAVRTEFTPKRKTLYLHQFLTSRKFRIDHRDGNGLNNQRHNLRPATIKQNGRGFRRKNSGASSKFRGVSWFEAKQKWEAAIRVSGRKIYLGRFKVEEDAARAYDAAARRYFGDFASPNFP